MFLQKIRRFCLILVVLICVFELIWANYTGVYAKPAVDDIVIEAEGGFGGIAKLGAWSPVTVRVSSAKRNISGEIEVEVNTYRQRRVIFSKPVELIAGIEQEVSFEVPVFTADRDIEIRLTEKNRVLAETTCSFKRLLSANVMQIGVLSEDGDAFNWLNGDTVPVAVDNGVMEKINPPMPAGVTSVSSLPLTQDDYYQKHEAVVVSLDYGSFPDSSKIMNGFNIFIISKYDTSLLNDLQISALEKWVEAGGLLVIGTGISWQKVYNGLPESLKPFSVTGIEDVQTSDIIERFTGRDADGIDLKLAKGKLISENSKTEVKDPYVILGDDNNPVAVKYTKGKGTVVVLTFDPTVEPFASWHYKTTLMENIFKYTGAGFTSVYGNGYTGNYTSQSFNMRELTANVPFDKVPPFKLMFIILGVYVIVVGPVLYIILKVKDKRDWAWGLIPLLSVLFLSFMYLFGYKTRYNTAVVNTASVIEAESGSSEASVLSAIGVFNNRRGTLTIEYNENNGIQQPFTEQDNDLYAAGNANQVVAKFTIGENVKLEQYDAPLWTPKVLYAKKTIPFDGNILNDITIKDGRLRGLISNSTPYDLLDAVLVIGNNFVRVGDIVAGDSVTLDIPLDGENVYKQPEEYLDAMYGHTWYSTPKEYPENFAELIQKRNLFKQFVYYVYNSNVGRPDFTLLAMNEQEFDYGLTVNNGEPQKYNKNLFIIKSSLKFEPGQEVEIPAGIIIPSMYQENNIAWVGSNNSVTINGVGDLVFEFVLPENITVNEMRLHTEKQIPLSIKYRMSQDSTARIQVLTNKYEFYLYNVLSKTWEEIKSDTDNDSIFSKTITVNDISRYIGLGNEVRMKISVTELGRPQEGVYSYYEEELTMPEIYIKGVSR